MKREEIQTGLLQDLTDEDQEHIRMVFNEEVAPKLARLDARLGTLNCEFAGEQYRNWAIQFKSAGSGFDIVDFEYDEEGDGIDLDL
ncbi:MAG: hypothetical protein ABII26_10675 [Pseudomonadota bacterium]